MSVYSILSDEFSDKFGFTEEEVKQILEDFEVTEDYEEIKKWYNGYKFGDTEGIYNPWSILNFVSSKKKEFKSYWTQTSSNTLIKEQITDKNAEEIREDILSLLKGEKVEKYIEENFVFPEMKIKRDLIWTLLLFSGYLTIDEKVDLDVYKLKIPNYELKVVFKKTVLDWLEGEIRVTRTLLDRTADYLVEGDLEKFEEGFRKIMQDTFSYYDTAKNNEYVFQAYLLGLLAILGDDYVIKSNRESGGGRYDILLLPKDKSKKGVVLELKQTSPRSTGEDDETFTKRINTLLDEAVLQIERNRYYNELLANGISKENILIVPIVFAGKEPFVRKIEN